MNDVSLTSTVHEDVPNSEGLGSRPRSAFIAPAIGLAFFLIQIPFARFALDSHHDGYMLAAAIGGWDGGVIHRAVICNGAVRVRITVVRLSCGIGTSEVSLACNRRHSNLIRSIAPFFQ